MSLQGVCIEFFWECGGAECGCASSISLTYSDYAKLIEPCYGNTPESACTSEDGKVRGPVVGIIWETCIMEGLFMGNIERGAPVSLFNWKYGRCVGFFV